MQKRLAAGGAVTLGVAAVIVLGSATAASAHVVRDGHVDRSELVHHGDLLGPARLRRLPHDEDPVPGAGVRHRGHADREPELDDHEGDRALHRARPPRPSDEDHAETAAERVTSVTYTAKTPLPADERDTFALSFSLPDGKAGDLVEFPAIQTCEKGSVEWNQEQKAGEAEPEHPAPSITLTAAEATDDDGDPDRRDPDGRGRRHDRASSDPDLVGRFLGLGGLVLGAVALVVAVAGTRRRSTAK